MKILQIIPYFGLMYGGTVRVVCDLSRMLAQRGHEVTVYTTDVGTHRRLSENDKIDLGAAADVRYFRCSNNRLAYGMKLHFSRQMRLAIKRNLHRFDVAHLHESRGVPNMYAWHYARKYGVPYVLEPDNSMPYILGNTSFKRAYDRIIGMRILRDAAWVIAISKEELEYIGKISAQTSLSLIYAGMDLTLFKNLPRYGVFRDLYDIQGTMILYLGRINESKGIEYLVAAFARLLREITDASLVIAGSDDGYLSTVKKAVTEAKLEKNVIFTGFISEEEKTSILVDADLFVHPVKFMGGVGIAPLEAILCNTPVVVTPECGEIIEKARCGYFVRYGDVEDLYQKMKYAISRRDENEKMIRRGKEYITRYLAWQNVVRQVEQVYERCTPRLE